MSRAGQTRFDIFLSHATEDASLAGTLRTEIQEEYPGLKVFLSEDFDAIRSTEDWRRRIKDELTAASLILVLATPASVASPWVYFEAGAGQRPVLEEQKEGVAVLCARGLHKKALEGLPLETKQVINLQEPGGVERLFEQIDLTFNRTHNSSRDNSQILAGAGTPADFWPLRLRDQASALGVRQLLVRQGAFTAETGLAWEDLLKKCRVSVRVVGWSCKNVVPIGADLGAFWGLLERGQARVQFLRFNRRAVKRARSLNFGVVCGHPWRSILQEINDAKRDIRRFAKAAKLCPEQAGRIEVRVSDWVIPWSAVAIDVFGKKDQILRKGLLQVEMFTCGSRTAIQRRPLLVLRHSSGGYYQAVAQSIKAMWDAAGPPTEPDE